MTPPPPRSTLFPYTTLFRSADLVHDQQPRHGVDLEALIEPVLADGPGQGGDHARGRGEEQDRKSTRLNSSHITISYAVFCLKKKKKNYKHKTCTHIK